MFSVNLNFLLKHLQYKFFNQVICDKHVTGITVVIIFFFINKRIKNTFCREQREMLSM